MTMHNPAHPGELLREYLPEAMTVTEAAERLGVTRQTLSAVLNGRAGISAGMDSRLAAALETVPGYWLRVQAQRDLWEARQRPRPRIAPFRRAA